MKAIRTKEVNENVKAANSCLRKAKRQAKELAVFTGEVAVSYTHLTLPTKA